MDEIHTFKSIFWDSFHRPALESAAMRAIWKDLEPINDLLAGPFFAIYENGNCNYVFEDKQRFPEILQKDDFLNWCIALIEQYKEEISNFTPSTPEEMNDKKILLYQTDLKMELSDLAYTIIKD